MATQFRAPGIQTESVVANDVSTQDEAPPALGGNGESLMASQLYLRNHTLVQRVRGVWSGHK